ncbi:MAG TPA: DUF58 domain-containing protein [Xanthomonadales bacterium]|nr:DUF58 domain-containing protein [Xanthomonadales bacterium]
MATAAASINPRRPGPRFERWVLERVRQRRGSPTLPFTLEYRHIYVMPTRFGAWFGALLAVTLLGGLNFNNNMALLLGFLLAAIAQLTTLLAYRNIVGMTLSTIHASPVFAGDPARFRVYFKNPEMRHRFALQLRSDSSTDTRDIGPQQSAALVLEQETWKRGWLEMQPFNLENRYPLGLFRAWSVIIPQARCLVYPQPAIHPPPLPRTGRGDDGVAQAGEGEHFHGLREYQPGDPLRRVAWRTSARHGKLYSRVMETPREVACELNWYLMGSGDAEEKLRILTAWILKAEQRQIPYSLELPTDALPAGQGEEHRDACLKILALYGT